jgi:hypothetical protein
MTAVAETAQAHHSALVLDLIRPFTEHDESRLRGNAVVALTVLVDGAGAELGRAARDELVNVLCAEPGGRDADWQRRFTAISIDAIRQLKPEDSEAIRKQVLQNLSGAREPSQEVAIARLVLAACDQGQRLWPATWAQFRRYATLAGRPNFWQCVWAAAWRSAIAWGVVAFGAELMDLITSEGHLSDDAIDAQCFYLGIITTIALTLIMRLSVPGRLRPPRNVYVVDTIVSALPFGLYALLGAFVMLSERLEEYTGLRVVLSVISAFLLGATIGAVLRWLRWTNARSAIEPDGSSQITRSASAFGLSAVACVAAAYLGMMPDIAAAVFLLLAPASIVLALMDVWLEAKGPRALLPLESRTERRWLLPAFAGAGVILAAFFFTWNLRTMPAVQAPEQIDEIVLTVAQEFNKEVPMGVPIPLRIEGEGTYSVDTEEGRRVRPYIRDAKDAEVKLDYDDSATLTRGSYTICATGDYDASRCTGARATSLVDHIVWAFGLFDATARAALRFTRLDQVPAAQPSSPAPAQ